MANTGLAIIGAIVTVIGAFILAAGGMGTGAVAIVCGLILVEEAWGGDKA